MKNEEKVPDDPGEGAAKPFGQPQDSVGGAAGADVTSGSGLTGVIDLSDPLKDVYLMLLKRGDMTMEEIIAEPSFEEKDFLAAYVKILARQGYLERYKANDMVKYRAVLADKGKKTVSDDIWDALS